MVREGKTLVLAEGKTLVLKGAKVKNKNQRLWVKNKNQRLFFKFSFSLFIADQRTTKT